MNLFLLWNVFSYRKELFYVTTAFVLVLALPLFIIFALTHAGIEGVSDKLISENVGKDSVNIRNPLDGKVSVTIKGPFIWPTTGIITLEFGESDLPYQPLHTGIDIANAQGRIGDPIAAFMKGKVIYADEISWGYGKHIILDNGNNVTSLYAHLSDIYVKKDQEVQQGQIIGAEGSTGWSTGPHLHFQTNVFGIPVNPKVFLEN